MDTALTIATEAVKAHPILTATAAVIGVGYLAANYWRRPGPSGFGSHDTAEDVTKGVDLAGKVAIVTGANSGIGFETARVLGLRGAHVVVVARSMAKATGAIEKMEVSCVKATGKRPQFTPMVCDLADLTSVAAFVAAFKAKGLPLHLLINNAGVMAMKVREETKQGFERQIGTNHLGHFALTMPLLPVMAATPGTDKRVVCLSSIAHRIATSSFLSSAKLEASEGYDPWVAYGNSKLSNVLMAQEINRRCAKDHPASGISAYSVHPGGIHTNLQTEVGWGKYLFWLAVTPFFFKSIPQGAATTVFCATNAAAKRGLYHVDCNGRKVSRKVRAFADDASAAKLWATSEKLTGITWSL